jgi:predicted HicB family RNase H-like nuclease
MPNPTPLRNVRVADALWQAAMAKALDRGENLSEVIRRALEKYVKG